MSISEDESTKKGYSLSMSRETSNEYGYTTDSALEVEDSSEETK